MATCEVAIVGAGPYGLSIAAHLQARGVESRVFGHPMDAWLLHMPEGMQLKSEGFASSLYDPDASFTLARYCADAGVPYADIGLPVRLETFAAYGREFQKRFVPQLESQQVESLRRRSGSFEVNLGNGDVAMARKVIVATGLSHYEHVPPVLASLPRPLLSHSSAHGELGRFKGREVTIVGAGASALDLAALLHEAGAAVQIVARKPSIRFHNPPEPGPPPLMKRLRSPLTGIGNGWNVFWCSHLPEVFRLMPEHFRLDRVRRILGPAPGWFIKERVVGKVPFNLGVTIAGTSVKGDCVGLDLIDGSGTHRTVTADHVIAATGYRVDLRRLTFLDSGMQTAIRSVDYTPVLSSAFESSLPGLYFVGPTAANTFGPLLRFAFGARFAARRLSGHLAGSTLRRRFEGSTRVRHAAP